MKEKVSGCFFSEHSVLKHPSPVAALPIYRPHHYHHYHRPSQDCLWQSCTPEVNFFNVDKISNFEQKSLKYVWTVSDTEVHSELDNTIRYDTIEEINVDSKAEYTA